MIHFCVILQHFFNILDCLCYPFFFYFNFFNCFFLLLDPQPRDLVQKFLSPS
jgi:hypothetical protein